MSEADAWSCDWRERRDESLARKAAPKRRNEAEPGDVFLVVTEGTVTEPIYFKTVVEGLQLPRVSVVVMPGWASDPRHVIETARREADGRVRKARRRQVGIFAPEKFDHVWAVIDSDVAVRRGIWNDVVQLAAARKVALAHSTPCFEYWLLLHLEYTTRSDLVDGNAGKHALKTAFGRDYSTTEETARAAIPLLAANWPVAVSRAGRVRKHHMEAQTPAPANPSTEVDRLLRALNDSAPEHMRKLIG